MFGIYWLGRALCVAAICLLLAPLARGDEVAAVSVTGMQNYSEGNGWVDGWGFTVDSGVTVTALGIWDKDNDGLDGPHDVSIWTVSGQQLQVSATVPSGTAGTLLDGFRYVYLNTPVALPAGDYRTATYYGYDHDSVGYGATGLSLAPGISNFVSRCYATSSTLVYPSSTSVGSPGYFGPNFLVPEPATLGLLALGGLALLRRRRKTA